MKKIDIRFHSDTMSLLQSLIGKEMNHFIYQRLAYTSSVYGMVAFQVEGQLYCLTNRHEVLDYMNQKDDVGVFKFQRADDTVLTSFWGDAELTETPVRQKITEIRVMNENQQLFYKGDQIYHVDTVRGIVFILEDGREISLEKDIWFSEMIDIKTGHNLMDGYNTMDDFFENWMDSPDYQTDGSREILSLH